MEKIYSLKGDGNWQRHLFTFIYWQTEHLAV